MTSKKKPDYTWVSPSQPSSVIKDIRSFKAFGNHEAMIAGSNSEVLQFNGTSWQSQGIWREWAYSYALDFPIFYRSITRIAPVM